MIIYLITGLIAYLLFLTLGTWFIKMSKLARFNRPRLFLKPIFLYIITIGISVLFMTSSFLVFLYMKWLVCIPFVLTIILLLWTRYASRKRIDSIILHVTHEYVLALKRGIAENDAIDIAMCSVDERHERVSISSDYSAPFQHYLCFYLMRIGELPQDFGDGSYEELLKKHIDVYIDMWKRVMNEPDFSSK